MPTAGQLPGMYNIVQKGEYELFDYSVPIAEFENMLRDDDLPDDLCVVGLEEVFEDDESIRALSRLMDRSADSLEGRSQLPTIQFAVDGAFQRRSNDFDLQTDNDLYRLSRVFGTQLERRDSGWLTAPF